MLTGDVDNDRQDVIIICNGSIWEPMIATGSTDWSSIVGIPADWADGVDNEYSGLVAPTCSIVGQTLVWNGSAWECGSTNTPPTAVADSYSTDENTILTIPVGTGVLVNDTDPDLDTLSASLVSNVSNGTLNLNANGSFVYTPNPGFSGTDSFTYRANDGTADSNTATVTITVNPVGPTGCPNIGNVCSDGSIFAGDGNMYVTDVNQSTSIQWAAVSQSNSGAQSASDGQANQAWIVANRTLNEYPAFQLCENLNRHGHSDWYLPSLNELNIMYGNKDDIGGFTTNRYWSSSEFDSNDAWTMSFGLNLQNLRPKTNTLDVRCVRRN